jgi:ribonuclease HII
MPKKLGRVDWGIYLPAPVIGVDEAGRGCLAGPVVAGAVILNSPVSKKSLYKDSKLLSAARRDELFLRIQETHQWSVGLATVEEIARLNILHAALLAMRRAVEGLRVKTGGGHCLVDGKFKFPELAGYSQTTFIKGDLRCEPIGAASIVAKVSRDRMMLKMAEEFPDYAFEVHKGYATALHRERLAKVGPCPQHRLGFAGVVGGKSDGDLAFEASV